MEHSANNAHTTPAGATLGSGFSYTLGYLGSIVCTLLAFWLAYKHVFSFGVAAAVVVFLAIVQLGVQLILFLHLGRGSKPRWNVAALSFAALIVCIVVAGTLWIMYNMSGRMMLTPAQMETYNASQGW